MEKASRSSVAALLAALWPCAFYFLCSLTMNLLTKTLVTTFQWRSVYTLGAVQSVFTLASLALLSTAQRVYALVAGAKQQPSVGRSVETKHRGGVYMLRVLLPLMALHLSNMLLGFASLRVVNLPMYLVLRRLTTITVMLIEWLVLRKAISGSIKVAILVSSAGSLIAGSTDVMSDVRGGYTLVLLQNLCTAMSLAFSKESTLTPSQLVIINSTAGAVCCSVLGFIFERDEVMAFPYLSDSRFILGMVVMCSMCVLYQFSVQLCTLRTSALTTSVTGNIKDLFATIGGYLLFPDAPSYAANFVGVALSFIGAYSFSYIRYRAMVGPLPSHQKQP
ncbi:UDP-N-acetylglucosamine/UDP-glucose/GDP-mannose transporter-like [Phytophthora cinnamomi]|uniref:UDP-N-acetylglucosamine/UDP-glucose/GDP-mannose transporter-like n=1 Tax=Phytophthora cinnamomi TaxID=4785 RepID=UPI003559ECE9|nr:UDP-N-acetylglucosamine/UDP-glucose/GDP-mannose transporter-like [Phytophthora cinnamomi]